MTEHRALPEVAWRNEPLLFERSRPGRIGVELPAVGVDEEPLEELLPEELRRADLSHLPELSEVDVVRHFTRISRKNYSVDLGAYPLGSCTMKHNPRINEQMARLPGFAETHPMQPASTVQGNLELMWNLERALIELTGMARVSLQPAAGAQGEFAGMLMVRKALDARGDSRRYVLIPDSAHGTNPASARFAGYEVKELVSAESGELAGYPVVDLRVRILDGQAHEVDSSERSFKIAASMALREAMQKAGPVLLEPFMSVEIVTPDDFVGAVQGDLNAHRASITGIGSRSNAQVITATAPLSQMFGYVNALRSMTQGRASYTMQFSHYETVPESVVNQIVGR